jgi:hypothetical protein
MLLENVDRGDKSKFDDISRTLQVCIPATVAPKGNDLLASGVIETDLGGD